MVSTGQILAAGVITGLAVGPVAWRLQWGTTWGLAAAGLSFAFIVGMRAISNVLMLNDDFMPAISIGDTLCLPGGAAGPAALALLAPVPSARRWLPALVGAVAGFLVNVVIL